MSSLCCLENAGAVLGVLKEMAGIITSITALHAYTMDYFIFTSLSLKTKYF